MKGNKRVSTPWNADTKHALGFYRILGKAVGIWPMDCDTMSSKFRIGFVVITQLWMSISLIYLLKTKGNCGSVTDIVDVLSLITCGFPTVLKVILPRMKRKKMHVIIESAVEDWLNVVNEQSRNTMLKYANMGRIVFIVQMSGAYAAGFPLIVLSLPFVSKFWNSQQANETLLLRQVPIGPSCWISSDESNFVYVIHYTIQAIQLIVVCTVYIGGDTYFFGIAMHVSGQFERLYDDLQKFDHNIESFKQKVILNEFVKRHNHLLKLAKYFEDTYNIIILAQVGVDTILACISGVVLLMTAQYGDPIIISGLIIRIYLVYIQLFMYSYVGENLSNQAEKLQIAIYNTPWYTMKPRIVKDMIFIMMRNNHPYKLTAGKMYTMNFSNFKNIIKAMGSYFSILRLMFIEK